MTETTRRQFMATALAALAAGGCASTLGHRLNDDVRNMMEDVPDLGAAIDSALAQKPEQENTYYIDQATSTLYVAFPFLESVANELHIQLDGRFMPFTQANQCFELQVQREEGGPWETEICYLAGDSTIGTRDGRFNIGGRSMTEAQEIIQEQTGFFRVALDYSRSESLLSETPVCDRGATYFYEVTPAGELRKGSDPLPNTLKSILRGNDFGSDAQYYVVFMNASNGTYKRENSDKMLPLIRRVVTVADADKAFRGDPGYTRRLWHEDDVVAVNTNYWKSTVCNLQRIFGDARSVTALVGGVISDLLVVDGLGGQLLYGNNHGTDPVDQLVYRTGQAKTVTANATATLSNFDALRERVQLNPQYVMEAIGHLQANQ